MSKLHQIEGIKIGTSSSNQEYGNRLDTVLVEIKEESKLSGLFTTNNLKAAPVQICSKNILSSNKNIA